MPLDTSTYSLALLRLDGRRWNELRRISAQISTQAAADGSSYLEMGNTKVMCTVTGPAEGGRRAAGGGGGGGGDGEASVQVEVGVAGFSGVERKRRGRGDKSVFPSLLFIPLLSTDIELGVRNKLLIQRHVGVGKQTHGGDANDDSEHVPERAVHAPVPALDGRHNAACAVAGRVLVGGVSECGDVGADRCRGADGGLCGGLYGRVDVVVCGE